jgi:hypothetical protein
VTTAVDIQGAWQTETYVANGATHSVEGVLLLTADRWATLYFVPFPDGLWGSAEAGSYAYDGTRLTFHHRLVFQGGERRPLEMNRSASRVEVCGVRLEGDRCSISFPSGNLLHLRRVGE